MLKPIRFRAAKSCGKRNKRGRGFRLRVQCDCTLVQQSQSRGLTTAARQGHPCQTQLPSLRDWEIGTPFFVTSEHRVRTGRCCSEHPLGWGDRRFALANPEREWSAGVAILDQSLSQ